MEANKILTADLLDLLFDNRNKGYGAYELRKKYQQRIIKSLTVTTSIAGIVFALFAFGNYKRHTIDDVYHSNQVIVDEIKLKPEDIPEPPRQPDPPQVRTEIVTPPVVVEDDQVEHSMPTQDDIDSAKIGLIKTDGINDTRITEPTKLDGGKGVVDNDNRKKDEPEIYPFVEIEAQYIGNWGNFLRKNLRPEVPVDNGAPAGRYTIIIQFIVDVDGTVSDITPLTHLGYGMEEEAVRVLKKANKWEPAFQNGIHVKAYRKQPITFEVLEDN